MLADVDISGYIDYHSKQIRYCAGIHVTMLINRCQGCLVNKKICTFNEELLLIVNKKEFL